MSVSTYGMIETRYDRSEQWFAAAEVYFYGDVHVNSLLANPWGDWCEEDGNPPPVVPPRGLPPGLSLMTLHKVGWVPHAEGAKEGEPRCISPRKAKAKKFQPLDRSFVLDTTEWRCLTWLTTAEIKKAADTYRKFHSRRLRSPELEGILAMMRAFEKTRNMEVRLVLWFQ